MRIATPTAALSSWIQRKIGPVRIGHVAHIGSVLHESGAELTDREQREVLALIAADAAEPLTVTIHRRPTMTTQTTYQLAASAIITAPSLDLLCMALNMVQAVLDPSPHGDLRLEDIVDMSSLTQYGGECPEGALSCDDDRVLWHGSHDGLFVVEPRDTEEA